MMAPIRAAGPQSLRRNGPTDLTEPLHMIAAGPDQALATLLLAHGAGAPMDSPFMNLVAGFLADRGVATLRF